jgi:hypothetical protein
MDKNKKVFINGIDNRRDIKASTLICAAVGIDSLKTSKEVSVKPDTKLIILTTSSIIYGTVLLDNNNDNPALVINHAINEARNNFLKEEQSDNDVIVNNSAYLRIKDATIRPLAGGRDFHFQILNIFSDQILGFSFGEINNE